MADFVQNLLTNSGSINFPKFDQVTLPVGTDVTRVISGSEWNSSCQALFDLRSNALSGSIKGFGQRFVNFASISAPAGIGLATLDCLYIRSDGSLIQHKRDGTEFVLAAAAANVQYSQYPEIDSASPPTVLPALTQGSVILYVRSNGSRTAGSRRTQLVVRWGTDNSDTVVAEGPLY